MEEYLFKIEVSNKRASFSIQGGSVPRLRDICSISSKVNFSSKSCRLQIFCAFLSQLGEYDITFTFLSLFILFLKFKSKFSFSFSWYKGFNSLGTSCKKLFSLMQAIIFGVTVLLDRA